MISKYPLTVRYVLYSHYPEDDDFNTYERDEHTPLRKLEGVQSLVAHLDGLRGLLTWPGYEGLLVLFYAPGLAKCLDGIAAGDSENDLLQKCKELKFARAVDTYLQDLVNKKYGELGPRLRFVTALDLHKVFGRMKNSEIAGQLQSWIVGDAEGIRYDSPKIIEAIVRLRLLGSGIPVFRVDHDVLFRGDENRKKKNLEFSSTIGSCLTAYELRRDSPSPSFIFSASYDYKALLDSRAVNDSRTWSRAFATRIFPALPLRRELIANTLNAIRNDKESEEDAWERYAADSFSPSLARKFFGFENEGFKTTASTGIGYIGAHPLASVISGAMLYLSDGAILDLPPFSNFRLNVSWIDDHLKYCLHRELRHLTPPRLKAAASVARSNPLLSHAKLNDVLVQKTGRKIRGDLRKYIFDKYLPTLLWGTIMDAWITPHTLLKHRLEDLSPEDQKAVGMIQQEKESEAVLASALQRALEECSFGAKEAKPLEKRLFQVALERINEVRRQWRDLTEPGLETFASIWAKGKAKICFPELELKYLGIADPHVVPVDKDISRVAQLDGSLIEDLHRLVSDATEYIEWTRNWPTVVQVVRSIEQGTLKTDLNFDA